MLHSARASWRCGVSFLALAVLCTGCFLKPKSHASGGSIGAYGQLINRTSVVMERLGDGDSLQIQFATAAPAACQLSYYVQDPNGTPTQASPTTVPCVNQGTPQTTFTEEIDGLRTDELYMVTITAWPPGSDAAHGDSVLVRESPSTSSVVGGDGNTQLSELFVALFDLPLLTAEVHRNVPAQPVEASDIKGQLTRAVGCQTQVPTPDAAFRDADPTLGLTGLTTTDLAAATAAAHPDYQNRLLLSYQGLNNGVTQWTLNYTYNSKGHQVPSTPVARIANMEMESTQIVTLDSADLTESSDPLKIDATKPLKFSWTVNGNLLDLAYVTVEIGRPNYDKAVYCIFPASAQSGVVDSKYLQALDDGTHVVTAELSQTEIYVPDGWVAALYDWRSGQIEK